MLNIKTSKQSKALPRDLNVLDIKVTYDQFVDGEKTSHTEEVKAKLKFVKPGEEQKEPTKDVIEVVGLAKIVEAQIKAEVHANAGNYTLADQVMVSVGATLDSFKLHQHATHAVQLGAKMKSQAVYTSSLGYRASSKKGLTRGVENYDKDVAADMSFVCSSMPMSNEAQSSTASAFDSSDSVISVGHTAAPVVTGSTSTPGAPSVQEAIAEDDSKKNESKKAGKSKSRSSRW